MHYTLLLHYPERSSGDISDEEVRQGMNSFDKWAKEIEHAGHLVSAQMLQRTDETMTVQIIGETLEVSDGPAWVVDAPIGGIIMLDVPDDGEALAWARRAPSVAWGPVEVRGTMVRFTEGEWRPEEVAAAG